MTRRRDGNAMDGLDVARGDGEGLEADAGDERLAAALDASEGVGVEEDGEAAGTLAPVPREPRARSGSRAPESGPVNEPAAVYAAIGSIHPWADNPRWKDKK